MIKHFSFKKTLSNYQAFTNSTVNVNGVIKNIPIFYGETELLYFIYDIDLNELITIIPENILKDFLSSLEQDYQTIESDFSNVSVYATNSLSIEKINLLEKEEIKFSDIVKDVNFTKNFIVGNVRLYYF